MTTQPTNLRTLVHNWDENVTLKEEHYKKMERIASTPLGQTLLELIDRILSVMENTIRWCIPQERNNSGRNYNSKAEGEDGELRENGEASVEKETNSSILTRPLPWVIFIPLLIGLHIGRWNVNFLLFLVNGFPLQFEDVKCSVETWRQKVKTLQSSGSNNIREQQTDIALRLQKNPPEINVVCRVFSKFPLRLCVGRLRKILNYVGVITLPRPGELKRTASGRITQNNKRKRKEKKENDMPEDEMDAESKSEDEGSYSDESDSEKPEEREDKDEVSGTQQEVNPEERTSSPPQGESHDDPPSESSNNEKQETHQHLPAEDALIQTLDNRSSNE